MTEIKPQDVTRDIEQLAMFMNARDVAQYGTATWELLDHAGREEYTKEASAYLNALIRLGWMKS